MKRITTAAVTFIHLRTTAARVAAAALLGAGAVAATAAPALADYGPGNVYQVEISSNASGPNGGGIWLWFALSPSGASTTSGTGDYQGSDCGHGIGATADSGDVTWSVSGGTLTINGVVLNGLGGLDVTVTVPAADGHYSSDIVTVFPTLAGPPLFLPAGAGFSQVQVAP